MPGSDLDKEDRMRAILAFALFVTMSACHAHLKAPRGKVLCVRVYEPRT